MNTRCRICSRYHRYAASLYNLMRNTGAAIGISYMTTVLVNHEQRHQSYLVGHFTVFDAWKMSDAPRLISRRAQL